MPHITISASNHIIFEKLNMSEIEVKDFVNSAHELAILQMYKPEDICLCITRNFKVEKRNTGGKRNGIRRLGRSRGYFLSMVC